MPPELVALGDQLEAAASRALARRRTRRQLVLNAAESLIVAVPLTVSVATSQLTATSAPATTATPTPTVVIAPAAADDNYPDNTVDDFLPRDLRRMRLKPQSELLILPASLRPALR